eukprot:CAMPEP_0181391156 /NCGR_PEP_ID=MMETSP1106-20121128/25888_1 /TAXON_ID=81844 /ORGANISM="Mantoniella antarctica, Strain SL-175" /LENGTH=125 /DNA_ID=CAMNT_0023512155 /DNA_START=353 /DNA_END=728 /DNA_ORIENTATION=-
MLVSSSTAPGTSAAAGRRHRLFPPPSRPALTGNLVILEPRSAAARDEFVHEEAACVPRQLAADPRVGEQRVVVVVQVKEEGAMVLAVSMDHRLPQLRLLAARLRSRLHREVRGVLEEVGKGERAH